MYARIIKYESIRTCMYYKIYKNMNLYAYVKYMEIYIYIKKGTHKYVYIFIKIYMCIDIHKNYENRSNTNIYM